MTAHRNLWLFFGLVPIAMATYMFRFDSKPLESGTSDNILVISALVQQVKELQEIVKRQGQHIEALETRITVLESSKTSDEAKEKPVTHANHYESAIHSGDLTLLEASLGEKHDRSEQTDEQLQKQQSRQVNRGIRSSDQQVAFSAYLDHNVFDLGIGQTIKFNQVLLNDGNGYNSHTGVFVAPITGTYFFIYYIHDYEDRAKAKLVVDDILAVSSILHTKTDNPDLTAGNTAILHVNAGQAVWVEIYGYDDSDLRTGSQDRYVTFSGFLIYPVY